MSDPKACPSTQSMTDLQNLQCAHGHQLIHKVYYDDQREEIAQLKASLAQKDTIINSRLVKINPASDDEDHLRVEQAYDQVQLTLRGKSKLFSPKAIADLIRVLKKNYNAANNYTPAAIIHCSRGIEG